MENLNQFLQPNNSPIAQNQAAVDAFTFDYQTERNAISQTKFPFFSFSKGQGGTLTLGGLNDGNGFLVVQNTGGSTVATIDHEGFIFYNGTVPTILIGDPSA